MFHVLHFLLKNMNCILKNTFSKRRGESIFHKINTHLAFFFLVLSKSWKSKTVKMVLLVTVILNEN